MFLHDSYSDTETGAAPDWATLTHDSDHNLAAAIDDMTLEQAEEFAYGVAAEAGRNEFAMWLTLARLRDTEKWRNSPEAASDPAFGWEDYVQGWLHEACRRVGRQLPWSLREAQTRLSVYRRLVASSVGAPAHTVLAASSDAMAKLTRAMGTWNAETGELIELRPAAKDGLDKLYPRQSLPNQIRAATLAVAAIPIHKEAVDFIKEHFEPANSEQDCLLFAVTKPTSAPFAPTLRVRVLSLNEKGDVSEDRWYGPTDSWPDWVIAELERRLGAGKA